MTAGARFGPLAAAVAAAAAAGGLWLAAWHPLSAAGAIAAVLLLAAGAAWRPMAVPVLLIGLLPVAGLAPWTGWMLVEEFDLLLLALLAGAWARLSWHPPPDRPAATGGAPLLWWMGVAVYVAAAGVSLQRGLADAGGLDWGWWQGWREPMNVLRTAKPLAWALLAWPLWQRLQALDPPGAARAAGTGAFAGLAVVSALATWERWAWPGLANFSSDYRTTALFWETHIGGAALDGFLALTLPFAVWMLHELRGRRARWLALAVAAVAGYAVLTTFSRGLYLGAVVGGLLLWWRMPRDAQAPAPRPVVAAGWVLLFAAAAAIAFPGAGWRGMLALWALAALALLAGQRPAGLGRGDVAAFAAGLAAGAALVLLALQLPLAAKAPYLLFALAAGASAAGLALGRTRLAVGGWGAAAAAAVGVAAHWGGAAPTMAGAVALLVAAGAAAQAWPAWRGPAGGSWRVTLLAVLGGAGVVVGSVAGGGYLTSRVEQVGTDWDGRVEHWTRGASLPFDTAETLWGIGSGRFAARFALTGVKTDQTGDYRWAATPEGGELVLTGGMHVLGFGEYFRMAQRVPAPSGAVTVRWRAFVERPVTLHLEICNKHLLYDQGCSVKQVPVGGTVRAPEPPGWKDGTAVLPAAAGWKAPVFAVALDSRGARIRIDRLEAVDAAGRELLANPGFDDGLARWLPGSDRHHLPWHAKNLGLHLVVEQGWIGATLFGLLLLFVAARLLAGRARTHTLAAPLLAGLAGYLVVGLFDSLLDVPRVAFALLWFMGIAATLRADTGVHSTLRSGVRAHP